MKKMKKFMTILACFVFILVGSVAFTACGEPATMTEEAFLEGIEAGSVKLTGNVSLSAPVEIDSEVTIDLNGFAIDETIEYVRNVTNSLFVIKSNGKLTVKGSGSVNTDDVYIFKVTGSSKEDASLTIEGGYFESESSLVYVIKGKAEIKGGEFKMVNEDVDYVTKNSLNTKDPNTDGEITVYAGVFHGYNPKSELTDAKLAAGSSITPDQTTLDKDTVYTVTVNA